MLRMFAETDHVERPGEMTCTVPLDGGSIEDSRENLIANPTPCMRFSSGSLPCQHKVHVWSPAVQRCNC